MNRVTVLTVSAASAALLLTGCTGSSPKTSAQAAGQQQTETAFRQQSSAVPYPAAQLRDSLERRNIRERLLRTNNPTKIQYVYLLGMNGTYIGYYAIKGKVSSTQSQMTTAQLIQRTCKSGDCSFDVVNAPGDDGSYGDNEQGIFFFTTEGVMVTTSMDYIVSDAPLPVSAPKLNGK